MSSHLHKLHAGQTQSEAAAAPEISFPTRYEDIMARVAAIDPGRYGRSRNFLNGAITYLSPYLSRGVISTRQVYEALLARGFTFDDMQKLASELGWRDFFQRVWEAKGEELFTDLRQPQPGVAHRKLPVALPAASTGIAAVDAHIGQLYATGYLHNHLRLYVASLACNIGRAHWAAPAAWLYYHLLDGDLASNTCSWQWVAGAFSSKPYYCNQENINHYTGSQQRHTYLDVAYSTLPDLPVPPPLRATTAPDFTTLLPVTPAPVINPALPLLLYNSYHLDPQWRADEPANRVLLLEPSHFRRFPVSEAVLSFIQQLALDNIAGVQIFVGEVAELVPLAPESAMYTRQHPSSGHYPGTHDARAWLVPEVAGYFTGYFNYWKKCEKVLRRQEVGW
ncbi:FAD-binding domain-containing protein [Hymenobacter psychrophilus]|uniref:Deoxyribodipyrimidine photo-lyase n=1 Tax=Hymenobacter psychrophilus TaxID=651662 RepID=A0A1H3LM03_9BACT|nr:FAD-binding domain-containing protein [Hymenobacter psychrophilus]SDY65441.1 deoxyribodipyrimidine photo-lyase [Hymenobacter psychrophilus]